MSILAGPSIDLSRDDCKIRRNDVACSPQGRLVPLSAGSSSACAISRAHRNMRLRQGLPPSLAHCRTSSSPPIKSVWVSALDNSGHLVKAPLINSCSRLVIPEPFILDCPDDRGNSDTLIEQRRVVSARYPRRASPEAWKRR